jgi:hypothetical protein
VSYRSLVDQANGFAPSELLPVRIPRSRTVRDSTYV